MTIETALQSERKSVRKCNARARIQHFVPWPIRAQTVELQTQERILIPILDGEFRSYRSNDLDTEDRNSESECLPSSGCQWQAKDPELDDTEGDSSDCDSDSDRNRCPVVGVRTRRRLRWHVHSRHQQQLHLHPRASPWSRIIQFQLVLVLSLVLVFSGINSAVNCDENVTIVSGSGSVVADRKPGLGFSVFFGNRSSSSSSSYSDETKHVLPKVIYNWADDVSSVNVIDEKLDGARHFTHHWAVHIPDGDQQDLADRVAAEHGFINRGKIFHEHYHFEHSRLHKRSLNPSKPHQQRLESDRRVRWAKQQRAKSRQKRDFRPLTKAYQLPIQLNDPKWPEMWYLNRGNGLDMNVIPAWKEGVTGKGVVVTILDDGLESDHPDLEHNYDPYASYDVNSSDNDPMPHYDLTDSNRHGTRCAGEVAATANNSKCAVGIAYGAKVGGVRMLDGDVTDIVEARSLGHNSQHIDIYSASWGPDDDGKTVDGPGELATRAFIEGVRNGRGGKGSIFIWASGNGGREHDNCNCDGYTNSIWTLSISSTSQEGQVPWFSEMCSSTLATTYSSGNTNEKQVITTDLHHTCTSSHTGTSASAPLAAGIAALVLEANRNLTWRDLQHIVVRTAKPANLIDPNWSVNGVGRRVSHSFGYGLMDAAAMVRLARTWKTVPEQQVCEINARHLDKQIPPRTKVTMQLIVEHCMGVNYLEHVQAKITLTSQRRGDIKIFLTSPSGTRVTLLTPRSHDLSRSGFNQWPFMSVHTWGEAPHGTWQLEIHNEGRLLAQITQWDLIFYGTETPAQPNDPVRFGKPGYDSNFGGEMEHNALEFDSGVTSDQWRDMQQVSSGHSEVQRTSSNDVTAVSCARFDAASCIECKSTAYHYKGRCYIQCPPGTYPSASLAPEPNNNGTAAHQPDIDEIATNYGQRPLPPSSLRRRRQAQHVVQANSAPTTHQPNATTTISEPPRCLQCHTTCLKCVGPKATDCTECQAAFRFQPIASGGESRICVSINDKQQYGSSANNNGSPGRLKALGIAVTETNATHAEQAPHSYLPSVLFLAGVLVVAVVAIYVLWLHCFQGTPGSIIADLTGASSGDGGDGGGGGGGGGGGVSGSAGLASIRYDRVHTNEQDEEAYVYEDDDESGETSGDDDGELLSVSATKIIAPIER
ncbi:furin-like protease 1 [Anopheles maculipalpis]|uniref:furin-like protease 1 n=1 Tax=Anopheles maculipalpis TaxID=1496333 RepID=UPI0021596A59|nr:furin-like protease 1 [Anopheles maculipalpis]